MACNEEIGKQKMLEPSDTEAYLRVLWEFSHTLSEKLEESEVIEAVLDLLATTLAPQAVLIRLLNPDADALRLAGARGLSDAYLEKGEVRLDESAVDQAALNGEVITVDDVRRASGYQYPRAASEEGLRGMVVVPLSVRHVPRGVLRLYVEDTGTLASEDISLLRIMADMAALALEKVRLQQSLYRIAEAVNSSRELKPMLQHVLEAAVEELGLKGASIRLLDPREEKLRLIAATGLSESYLQKGSVKVAKSPVDQQTLEGEAVVLFDVEEEPGFQYPNEAAREGIRSVLIVPLHLQERNLGVMRVYSARPRHFGSVSIRYLTSVADLVALAIENAQLYAQLQHEYEELKVDLAEWYRFLALG
jgi:GAF domain-containing protein